MSIFKRPDPNHPLLIAARDSNSYSEEYGLEKTVEWTGMDMSVEELVYLSEQRALRAIAAAIMGVNLTPGPESEAIVQKIIQTPLWKDMAPMLMSIAMDGIVIGWVGRGVSESS